jgi:hypothetical protein
MSNDPYLNPFLTNGETSYQGQQNAGGWQASAGQPLSGQQSFESFGDYAVRESAYNSAKKQQGG